ncbi:hypothetical protein J1N35_024732 [Gossypium stocksii]|uniref:Uncharacterized protein n=1 Tax=Gossypium stocksii TaxID=47602 RepID=A0A9D3V585_9ROSI|nr:hypothetical protein J1N35_024732 [Gossypium stocksii]
MVRLCYQVLPTQEVLKEPNAPQNGEIMFATGGVRKLQHVPKKISERARRRHHTKTASNSSSNREVHKDMLLALIISAATNLKSTLQPFSRNRATPAKHET